MNGEMYQICCITVAAKNALKTKSKILYIPLKYEDKIEFHFLPEKGHKKNYKAESIVAWYDHCLKKDLQDVKIIFPVSVEDRNILGFSNTTQSSLVCFWGSALTYFSANCQFDSYKKMWNTFYTEQEWKNALPSKPEFKNNSENFKDVLIKIKELAFKIDCNYFAEIFQKAFNVLSGIDDIDNFNMSLPEIPEEHQRLFKAASVADVFGAMGSWNDSPPYMAFEKGMVNEYNFLSGELLKQIRLAILYAINEW